MSDVSANPTGTTIPASGVRPAPLSIRPVRIPFGPYLFVWMGLGLLLLTGLLAWGAYTNRTRNEWVGHSQEVLRRLSRFEAFLLEAQMMAKTSAPLDRDSVWKSVELRLREAESSLAVVRGMVADHPAQSRRAADLARMFPLVVADIRHLLPGVDPSAGLNSEGDRGVLLLVEALNAMRREEQALLAQREKLSVSSGVNFWRLTALAILINLTFIWLAASASRRYLEERNAREARIHDLNARLANQVEETNILNDSLAERVHLKTAELEKTVENLTASKAELERFSYVASHHLQEPLRQVASFVDLVLLKHDQQLDGGARRYLVNAVAGAKRLQIMLRGLQEYTVLASIRPRLREFTSDQLVSPAVELIRQELEQAGGTLQTHFPEGAILSGEPSLLRRALNTLLVNAIRFRRPGVPPVIEVNVEVEERRWRLSVSDNGIGVDPRFTLRIFEMFSRLDSAHDHERAGTGLAIAKKIVELHDGSISVLPTPSGEGATFQISIPRSINTNLAGGVDLA